MPAHIKTMLTATSLQVPVLRGELALGTWQAIYLIEHRARPHRREIVLQFIGSTYKTGRGSLRGRLWFHGGPAAGRPTSPVTS